MTYSERCIVELLEDKYRLQRALNRAKDFIRQETINSISVAGNHAEHIERQVNEPGCEYARLVLKEVEEIESGFQPVAKKD